MTFENKIESLSKLLKTTLTTLIDHDYVLWDIPYYNNIGDILIWEGERAFLKGIKYKCLDYASVGTCLFPKLSKDTIILLGGGGNFGDLWRWFQEFRLEVIRRYPENRIIIFPQSVYYENIEIMKRDAEIMTRHKKLIICAREQQSYEVLNTHFQNEIVLLPDMAFCIDPRKLDRNRKPMIKKNLFLRRRDKELGEEVPVPENSEIRDWPSIERSMLMMYILNKALGVNRRFKKYHLYFLQKIFSKWTDHYACNVVRPVMVRLGIRFLSQYRFIYTTRLHVMILSVLLGKGCRFMDNSYGKNSAFYKTWLKDLPDVSDMSYKKLV